MKKLAFFVFAVVGFMIFLVIAAFFYVDVNGHIGYRYRLFADDIFSAVIKIDRYVTEDKIIYKSNEKYSRFEKYPEIREKLFLDKKNMAPLKFVKNSAGVKDERRLTLFVRNEGKYDLLFLEFPEFINFEKIKFDIDRVIFSPKDIMSYMPLIERYNFWKKGTQFFNVLIPIDKLAPPIEGEVEIRYLQDEYILFNDCKTEVESFIIKSNILPEIKVFLSKYMHRVLIVEIEKQNIKFVLTQCIEGPDEKIEYLKRKVFSLLKRGKITDKKGKAVLEVSTDGDEGETIDSARKQPPAVKTRKQEIFVEPGDSFFAGEIWIPFGEGKFPAIIISSEDTPGFNLEQDIPDLLGEFFSEAGFITLTFNNSGRRKSQGKGFASRDKKNMANITAAAKFLAKYPLVANTDITLIGLSEGAYAALMTASSLPEIKECVLLNLPLNSEKAGLFKEENIEKELEIKCGEFGVRTVSADVLKENAEKIKKWREDITKKTEKTSFFLGIKVPVKEYKDFLLRDPYQAVLLYQKPLLLIFEKDNLFFDSEAVNLLRKLLNENKSSGKVQIVRNFGIFDEKAPENDKVRNKIVKNDVFKYIAEWIAENNVQKKEENIEVTLYSNLAEENLTVTSED